MSSGDTRYTGLRSRALIGGPGEVRGRWALWIVAVILAFALGFLVGYLVARVTADGPSPEERPPVGEVSAALRPAEKKTLSVFFSFIRHCRQRA